MNRNDEAKQRTDGSDELVALRTQVAELQAWVAEARPVVDGLVAQRAERLLANELENRRLAAQLLRESLEVEAMITGATNAVLSTADDRRTYVAAANGAVTSGAARLRSL